MSNGALVQLNAIGTQNDFINKNPEITFFKFIYKRYANFGVENIELNFNAPCNFGGNYSCNILHNADLISKMYLKITISEYLSDKYKWAWISHLGHFIIDYYSIDIGGISIDKQYGRWLDVWYELTKNIGQERGYNEMIGNTDDMVYLSNYHPEKNLWIPLKFWFNRYDSCALPIIAIKYQDIYVNIKLSSLENCLIYENGLNIKKVDINISNCSLFVDYIFLDKYERNKFSNLNHEYLIEQIQFNGYEKFKDNIKITFNHPCKALFWYAQLDRWTNGLYLAYNNDININNDDSIIRVIATKRCILALASYEEDGYLKIFLNKNNFNLKPYDDKYENLFNRIKPIAIKNIPSIENIIINGELLNEEEISFPIDNLYLYDDEKKENKIKFIRQDENNLILSDGSQNKDINLKLWNNYGKYLNKKGSIIKQYALSINNYYIQSFIDNKFFKYGVNQ